MFLSDDIGLHGDKIRGHGHTYVMHVLTKWFLWESSNWNKKIWQAGAELGQAQAKLELG